MTIRAVGSSIEITQNGVQVASFQTDSDDFKERFAASKFATKAPLSGSLAEGHIGLQDHGGKVWYRNILVTPIDG